MRLQLSYMLQNLTRNEVGWGQKGSTKELIEIKFKSN